jgi:diadenosine tetraphosphatase ApaH/serine/threonine PP2A family protein phosphatase
VGDERLRELERRWKASGRREDELAYLRERERVIPSTAVLACVHGNLEALEAVLADVDERRIKRVICLGDVTGYGPNPIECLDLIMARCEWTLLGNHDEALLKGAANFGAWARTVVEWTQELMRPGRLSFGAKRRRWRYLEAMPERREEGPDLYVHGSPRLPTLEYILREDIWNGATQKFEEIFAAFERLCFVAHSHVPNLVTEAGPAPEEPGYHTASELDHRWEYPGEGKAIINVGSVGQPRDEDPRACYAIFDGEVVTWRRVEYDVEKTGAKILSIPEFPEAYADRLRRGI